ncbi:CDP-diacylglycerol--serine O-phosphatidyltransferase [Thiogranum longum]|uniref:CDP-diacylglycerol--serine O-phosphatidyltransferase n=1 Tax=Thiogranum longum TaxID=1537524 RepID=A0A4R1HBR4_9GAMM|nr:CDP-diacylglycerol--serine O-phosphatidyltransferase [Thiogranum longum]TCK17620.1 CDP-diacylglycerol--serine O-phosphatidyltransferase [Thiogranum longum]
MDEEQQTRPRRRGIYLLPNLFTTAGLFAGFYAIVSAMSGNFEVAAIAIFVAMVMDGIDGRVARLTNTQSEFGVQYDSLSDMVCFGLAPSLIIFEWALRSMIEQGWIWNKLGWLSAFVYTAGAALRLARFNTQVGSADKHYFQGLPSPSAAAVLAGLVWFSEDNNLSGEDMWMVGAVLAAAMGALMVSNVRYYSFKEIDFKNRVPFVALVLTVFVFVVISSHPPSVLFFGFLLYVISGPVLTLYQIRQRRRQRRQSQ